jgi:hypothetical protein
LVVHVLDLRKKLAHVTASQPSAHAAVPEVPETSKLEALIVRRAEQVEGR